MDTLIRVMKNRENKKALEELNYKQVVDQESSSTPDVMRNEGTGDILTLHNGKIYREVQLSEVEADPFVMSHNSKWTWPDVQDWAEEYKGDGMTLTKEQSIEILMSNEKGISEYGFDGIDNALDSVQGCAKCPNGIDILPNGGDESFETIEGDRICVECKEKGGYVSCTSCEAYVPKELQTTCPTCKADHRENCCTLCPTCLREQTTKPTTDERDDFTEAQI